jgi:hypothetical protein
MNRPEHQIQKGIIDFWRLAGRRDLRLIAIPNGELRAQSVALRLKAEGVVPGVPDLLVVRDDGRVGWLEVKAPGGSMSDAQKGFAHMLVTHGHAWALVRGIDEAQTMLGRWGALR